MIFGHTIGIETCSATVTGHETRVMLYCRNEGNCHSELNDLEKSQLKGGFIILLHYSIFEGLFLFSMQDCIVNTKG